MSEVSKMDDKIMMGGRTEITRDVNLVFFQRKSSKLVEMKIVPLNKINSFRRGTMRNSRKLS